jgi:hypothetical protein
MEVEKMNASRTRVLFVPILSIMIIAGSSFAAIIGPLDGVSLQSTFGLGTGYHEVAPAGWTFADSGGTSFLSSFGEQGTNNNAALCVNWPPSYGNYKYVAQFTTSVAALDNQAYQLRLLAGSLVNWEGGNASYTVHFGTVNSGVFTEFATSETETIIITGADFLCAGFGQNLSFTGMSGSVSGNLAIQIEAAAGDHLYWPAFDNVVLETVPEPISVLLFGIGGSFICSRRK